MTRRIAYVTGTRADYGLFSEPLKRIREHPELDLALIVTSMHLEPEFGLTVREIEADGMPVVASVRNLSAGDSGADQARSVGQAIVGLTGVLDELRPDLLIVLGDRGEMLAAAIAADHLAIPVAHVHGGELSGTVDELVRHAITKLSHIHFAATEESGERLRRMGEQPAHVHVIGAPGLDYLARFEPVPDATLAAELSLDMAEPFVLFTQHPVTAELADAARQMEVSLDALEKVGVQVVATYPNADAGGRAMIKVLEGKRDKAWLRIVPSLGHRRFASLLKRTAAMVGNSSSGIVEAPFFGVPVVNVGSRQQGRLRAGERHRRPVRPRGDRVGRQVRPHRRNAQRAGSLRKKPVRRRPGGRADRECGLFHRARRRAAEQAYDVLMGGQGSPTRIIPKLEVKGPNLIKGIHLEGLRVVGTPEEAALRYYREGADELIYMDIVASLYRRDNLLEVVRRTAEQVFIPLTVGGGVRSLEDFRTFLRVGADKVAMNTAVVARPEIITEAAEAFGSQCVVVSIEAVRKGPRRWEPYTDSGRTPTGFDAVEWAVKAASLGAGEILLTSIDMDGTCRGYDIELIEAVTTAVPIPVIASGGAGHPGHIGEAIATGGADAVAVAHILHFNKFTMSDVKNHLRSSGLPVREAPLPFERAS